MSPVKLYSIRLHKVQESRLERMCADPVYPDRVITRAKILVLSHKGLTDAQIAKALGVGTGTVFRIRKKYRQEGVDQALFDKEIPGGPVKFSAEQESALYALVCGDPPGGQPEWTLRLIKETAEREQIVPSISLSKIQLLLKKWGISKRR